eukprot:14600711-Heterocapsa_arctica.AAC.1
MGQLAGRRCGWRWRGSASGLLRSPLFEPLERAVTRRGPARPRRAQVRPPQRRLECARRCLHPLMQTSRTRDKCPQ